MIEKKDLNDLDNYNGVITNLESDILECEVKWALESITVPRVQRPQNHAVLSLSITTKPKVSLMLIHISYNK